jgi:hypothetical protein
MKLHLGCGTVYLDGYINIDHPDNEYTGNDFYVQRENNRTTLDKYYKRPYVKEYSACYPIVADRYIDILKIRSYFQENSIEEIVAFQVMEHFSKDEVMKVLMDWHSLLKPGGTLRVDVPDIVATFEMIKDVNNNVDIDYIIRLVYGSGKSRFFVHHDGYYPFKLKKMLRAIGYAKVVAMSKNIHDYPAFGFVCTK